MTVKAKIVAKGMSGKLVLTRVFDAPREIVFQAWTDPKHMAKWWGPKGFTTPICKMNVRSGGALHIVMRGPDGSEYAMTGVFQAVVAPAKLSFTFTAMAADGTPALEGLTSVTLKQHGTKTKLALRTQVTGMIPAAKFMLQGMRVGWTQSLVRLQDLVVQMKKT